MTRSHTTEPSQLLKDIAWAQRYGAFEDRLGRSLLRAFRLGVADDEVISMIHQRIRRLKEQEMLGQLEPFLAPSLDHGEILFGQSTTGGELRLPVQTFAAGMLLGGSTGASKTNTAKWLLPQIAVTGCRIHATDMHKRDLRHLLPRFAHLDLPLVVLTPKTIRTNLLQPPLGSDPRHHVNVVSNVLVRRLGLPPRSRITFNRGCNELFEQFGIWRGRRDGWPCPYDLFEWVRSAPDINPAAREATLDRFGAFLMELTPRCGAYRVGWTATDLADFNIIFEMGGSSPMLKQTLLETHLFALFQSRIESGLVNAGLELFMMFEDSQAFLDTQQQADPGMTPMDTAAGLIRGAGIGLGVNVQTMRGISRKLIPNLNLKIMGRMGTHEDYVSLGRDMGMTLEQIAWAKANLKPGVFIAQVADSVWREPFVLHVPHVRPPSVVTDEDVARSTRHLDGIPLIPASEYSDWSPYHSMRVVSRAEEGRAGPGLSGDADTPFPKINKQSLDYLQDVSEEPFRKISERDRTIGLSAGRGDRIRRDLIEKGLISPITITPSGRGRSFKLLELTGEARGLLQAFGIPSRGGRGRGGLRHQFWCHTISAWLHEQGLRSIIEDESRGARVDVAVETPDQATVAIEVECSSGHELENVRKDLEAGFGRVVDLVREREAVERVQDQVATQLGSDLAARVTVGCLREYRVVLRDILLVSTKG